MPALLGLTLVTLFIWFAENIGTYARAWAYPHQARDWSPVSAGKLGSWYLLTLVSYALVAAVNGIRQPARARQAAPAPVAATSLAE